MRAFGVGIAAVALGWGCGASPPSRASVTPPSWVDHDWLGLLPVCGDECLEVVSEDERRFVDDEGTAWRLVRSSAPEGTEVWRRREGTLPFVEERRLVGLMADGHVVSSCDGEGARRTEWTDSDRDGDIDSVREETRDGDVRTSRTDSDADGDCDAAVRTTTVEPGTRIERDTDCDGVFESDTTEARIREGSGC